MAEKLSPDARLEVVDWIVSKRTGGLHGDHRDPPPFEKLQGDPYTALLENARAFRQHLMALEDDDLLLEGQRELACQEAQEQTYQIGVERIAKEDERQAAERERARQAERGRRGGERSKLSPAILEACLQVRKNLRDPQPSAKMGWRELIRLAGADQLTTSDGKFSLRCLGDDRVGVFDTATGNVVRSIRERAFRDYWRRSLGTKAAFVPK
jgi:hypothetical protein